MSVQQRRKYDKDFKRNAVRLAEELGRTIIEVAENLGIAAFYIGGGESSVHEKALHSLVMAGNACPIKGKRTVILRKNSRM